MKPANSITVTIYDPSAGQVLALNDIMQATTEGSTPPKSKRGKKDPTPPKTDTSDEDEDESESDSEDEDESESDDEDESESDDEDEDDEGVTWDELKKALDKFGNKKPKAAEALLKSFKVPTTKALEKKKKIWAAVYKKVQAKNKAL